MKLVFYICALAAVLFSQTSYAANLVLTSPKPSTSVKKMAIKKVDDAQKIELRSQNINIIHSAVEQLRGIAKGKAKEPTTITLGLFSDVEFNIVLSSIRITKKSILAASGTVVGEPFGTAVIIADKDNNMSVRVRLPEKKRIYEITCDATNGFKQTVSEIDESKIKYLPDAPAVDVRKLQLKK